MPQFKLLFCCVVLLISPVLQAAEESPQVDQIRKVKLFKIDQNGTAGIRTFPADIVAQRSADISFRVSGQIKQFVVNKGDEVQKGQTLVVLDDTDYQVQVDNAKAAYSLASAQYRRIRESTQKAVTTAAQLDEASANLAQAKAALDGASNQLAYTVIKAPFSGLIADTYVEQEEFVGAATPVLTLIQIEPLNVSFDAPSSLLSRLSVNARARGYHPSVIFDQLPDRHFSATVKEISAIPDQGTRSYSITLALPKPAEINNVILPGMTASVAIDVGQLLEADQQGVLIPVESVFYQPGSDGKYVWLYNPDTRKISARQVQGDELVGNSLIITGGVSKGDQIVAAGTYLLYDGQTVVPWTSMEDK